MIDGLRKSLVLVMLWQDPLRPSAAKPILELDAPLKYRLMDIACRRWE